MNIALIGQILSPSGYWYLATKNPSTFFVWCINTIYATKIIYWAMSNGGQLRLYTDYGLVSINEKGKMTYTEEDLD